MLANIIHTVRPHEAALIAFRIITLAVKKKGVQLVISQNGNGIS